MRKSSQASALLVTILMVGSLTSVELVRWQSYHQQIIVYQAIIKEYQQKLRSATTH